LTDDMVVAVSMLNRQICTYSLPKGRLGNLTPLLLLNLQNFFELVIAQKYCPSSAMDMYSLNPKFWNLKKLYAIVSHFA